MMTIEALKQLTEAFEIAAEGGGVDFYAYAKAGRQAIAEAEKDEPVAWISKNALLLEHIVKAPIQVCRRNPDDYYDVPLYTHPQPRKRVVFPTMLRKMWSGGEVQAWLDENVNKE
jgi:hypothetical protein